MQADALSRFAKDHVHDREDNWQVMVLGPSHLATVAAAHFKPASMDSLGECIRLASQREAEVTVSVKTVQVFGGFALIMLYLRM